MPSNSVGKVLSERTFTGPAMFHCFWSITILTPGCSASVVVNTYLHSRCLSIWYDSVTFMVPMISLSSDMSVTSVPGAIFSSCDIVMGMGQKMPSVIFIPPHTPFQSSRPMKPARGEKPPIPNMMRSPVSRDDSSSLGRVPALFSSSSFSRPSRRRILNFSLPCGDINLSSAMTFAPPLLFLVSVTDDQELYPVRFFTTQKTIPSSVRSSAGAVCSFSRNIPRLYIVYPMSPTGVKPVSSPTWDTLKNLSRLKIQELLQHLRQEQVSALLEPQDPERARPTPPQTSGPGAALAVRVPLPAPPTRADGAASNGRGEAGQAGG